MYNIYHEKGKHIRKKIHLISLEFSLTTLCFQILSQFSVRREQVSFIMAIGNLQLVHQCFLKHLSLNQEE